MAPGGQWAVLMDGAVCDSGSAKACASRAEKSATEALEACQALAESHAVSSLPSAASGDEVRVPKCLAWQCSESHLLAPIRVSSPLQLGK